MERCGDFQYNPKKKLGKGGFGTVFEGHNTKDNSPAAIKCSNNGTSMQKEAEYLQKLENENVIKMYEFNGRCYAMEHCENGSLEDYLKANGPLSEEDVRSIAKQLAEIMKVLFKEQILHRDLKPENILLQSNVPNPKLDQIKIKLADLRVARSLEFGDQATSICGTRGYMAPEVGREDPYDYKADIYSIGCIVFKCLTGRAYSGELSDIPENIANVDLTNLLYGLLQPEPEKRFDSVQFYDHPFLRGAPKFNQHSFSVKAWDEVYTGVRQVA